MNKLLLFILYTLSTPFCWAQEPPELIDNRAEVKACIERFFEALHKGDEALMRAQLGEDVSIKSVMQQRTTTTPAAVFIQAITKQPRPNKWEEKLWNYQIQVDGDLASVWTDYSFFLDDKISHCGANHFLLVKDLNKGWQIINLIDSRRRTNCPEESPELADREAINKRLDAWHLAAAKADEEVFFGTMTVDGIYLGTDISERWLRDELKKWSKFAFDKETAWDFSPYDRELYFYGNDPDIVWFEESLKTWMGACRGSGVLERVDGVWMLKHYNLAVAVPNDDMGAYLKMRDIEKPKKK